MSDPFVRHLRRWYRFEDGAPVVLDELPPGVPFLELGSDVTVSEGFTTRSRARKLIDFKGQRAVVFATHIETDELDSVTAIEVGVLLATGRHAWMAPDQATPIDQVEVASDAC